jgi:hypothetical protein
MGNMQAFLDEARRRWPKDNFSARSRHVFVFEDGERLVINRTAFHRREELVELLKLALEYGVENDILSLVPVRQKGAMLVWQQNVDPASQAYPDQHPWLMVLIAFMIKKFNWTAKTYDDYSE